MSFLLIIAMIVSITSALVIISNKKFEVMLPITFFSIILVLYAFGLCGILHSAIYVIVIISVMCLILSAIYIYVYRKKIMKKIITPGFLGFIIFSLVFLIIHKGRLLSSWDEFSHWGLVVKNMYSMDMFGNREGATTVFRGYPPAVSLLQYFFTRIREPFIEANLFRASSIFIIALLLPIFKTLKWKQWKQIPIMLAICMVIPTVFYIDAYSTIYVDCLLAVLFSYILYTYFSSELNVSTVIEVALGAGVLTLTKASGTALAAIAILIIAIDLIIFKKSELRIFIKKLVNKLIIFLPIIMIIFGKYSWSTYLKITHTNEAWGTSSITLSGILNLFTSDIPRYRVTTIKNFVSSFFKINDYGYVINMSYSLWIMVFIIITIIIICLTKDQKEKVRIKTASSGLIIGMIVYTASLLILYLFTYSEYEAENLASLYRYMGTYLLGALTFLIFMAITNNVNSEFEITNNVNILILSALLCFANVVPLVNTTLLARPSVSETIEIRGQYSKSLNFSLDPNNDKVYFISQDTSGLDCWITYYNLTPVKASNSGWSLGKPYNDGDIWTKDIKGEEWADILAAEYTHVYLYKIDSRFKAEYGSLFENIEDMKNNSLYIIDKTNEGIKIRLVE